MSDQELAGGVVHELPADLREALIATPEAREIWEGLTPLSRNEWICWVDSARQAKTRSRRIEVGIDKLTSGMRRPCCWPGCAHRPGKKAREPKGRPGPRSGAYRGSTIRAPRLSRGASSSRP